LQNIALASLVYPVGPSASKGIVSCSTPTPTHHCPPQELNHKREFEYSFLSDIFKIKDLLADNTARRSTMQGSMALSRWYPGVNYAAFLCYKELELWTCIAEQH
jgi:hypothetical protein